MNNAVGLVQAYLYVNGYFTVTEYPVLEALEHGGVQSATDIDVVALRLPQAGGLVTVGSHQREAFVPDPALGAAPDRVQLIIGEVKEGRAELNRGATNPKVLAAVLHRFACCPANAMPSAIDALLRRGEATIPAGLRLEARLIAFGTGPAPLGGHYRVIPLDHVLDFLNAHLSSHWDVLRQAQIKDQTFGLLVMLEKARRHGRQRAEGATRG